MVSSLRANLSSLSTGASSLTDPDDALRSVMMLSAVLGHAPEPETADDIGEMLELKVRRPVHGWLVGSRPILLG